MSWILPTRCVCLSCLIPRKLKHIIKLQLMIISLHPNDICLYFETIPMASSLNRSAQFPFNSNSTLKCVKLHWQPYSDELALVWLTCIIEIDWLDTLLFTIDVHFVSSHIIVSFDTKCAMHDHRSSTNGHPQVVKGRHS